MQLLIHEFESPTLDHCGQLPIRKTSEQRALCTPQPPHHVRLHLSGDQIHRSVSRNQTREPEPNIDTAVGKFCWRDRSFVNNCEGKSSTAIASWSHVRERDHVPIGTIVLLQKQKHKLSMNHMRRKEKTCTMMKNIFSVGTYITCPRSVRQIWQFYERGISQARSSFIDR